MDKVFLTEPQTLIIATGQGDRLHLNIVPDFDDVTEALIDGVLIFQLYQENYGMFDLLFTKDPNYEAPKPEPLGRVLFDREGNWVYDGQELSLSEQQQVAAFITR